MMQAKKLGLTKPGYAFICYELLLDKCVESENNKLKEEEKEKCDALNGLLDISLFVPQNEAYVNFSQRVRRKMADPPFRRIMPKNEEVSTLDHIDKSSLIE